ncbi:hypothetical protein OTK49_00025 [Vibrio coralliirubri]|uniref:hypothetical protein n=1 Tax=Vibrio coralliirubri TaxID=1516159 RepID=UPI002285193B|nr:hypothetical protein [Vibrio coralliirubri]MCY9860926.1 hypothetical protein [Vibrio coralliirubri]
MKFTPIKIFGYDLAGNSCFDDCLSSMQQDNEVFGYSEANNVTFDSVMGSVSEHFDLNPAASSLAVLGMVEYAMRNQLTIANHHLNALLKAKDADPLGKYDERKVILSSFNKQLTSYISDQGLQTNEYCH